MENANHDLPIRNGQGLVMFTVGYWRGDTPDPGFRLAWMPLQPGGPRLHDTLYYTGKQGQERWSKNANEAATFFPHSKYYTSVSGAWLEGPKCWILLYSDATDSAEIKDFKGYLKARNGTQLWDLSEPIPLFDPENNGALGEYIHWSNKDNIHLDVPPLPMDPNRSGQREDKLGGHLQYLRQFQDR